MGWLRKTPADSQVGAKTDDEHPFPSLRDAIIGGAEQFRDDVVFGTRLTRHVVLFQSPAMLATQLAVTAEDARVVSCRRMYSK
jgi:hypothetical protein